MKQTIHPNTTLGEVKLKVSQLERSIRYYEQVVGLKVLKQEERTAQLTADGQRVLVILEEIEVDPQTFGKSYAGLYHFALLVPTREDLGIVIRHFIETGVRFGQADHLVSEALYLNDPDGNGIEIYRDRPKEQWTYDQSGQVEMATDPIDLHGLLQEAGQKPWQGLPEGTIMGHVHLQVGNLQQFKSFYQDVLGFDMMLQFGAAALFLSAGGYHHHIGLNSWAGTSVTALPEQAVGLDYYTIVLPDQKELQRYLELLEQRGLTAEAQDNVWVIRDPNGMKIHLRTTEA